MVHPHTVDSPLKTSLKADVGRYRWVICSLLFFATTVNYVDRSVLGVLAPTLRTEIGWTDQHYGYISGAFTLAYAIGYLFAGWLIDKIGTRIGYTLYLAVWSVAAAAHGLSAGRGTARAQPANGCAACLRPASVTWHEIDIEFMPVRPCSIAAGRRNKKW